jgi:hypothetical protein
MREREKRIEVGTLSRGGFLLKLLLLLVVAAESDASEDVAEVRAENE